MPPPDKLSILSASPAFAMLERGLLQEIAAGSAISRPGGANDDFLFRAGDRAEGLFLIVPGELGEASGPAVQVSFDDRRATASRVGYRLVEGELVGDVEVLMAGLAPPLPPRIASARALKSLQVLHIPAVGLDRAQKTSEAFRKRFVRDASRRLSGLLAEKAAETVAHPEVRLAQGMLALLDDHGHEIANKGVFAARLTQQDIADRLGMSRRLLSLRCSDWSARGLIETSPFGLPDIARLERIASFGRVPVRESLPAAIDDVERMIAQGRLARASHLAADALVVFPENPILTWLLALAGARMGADARAGEILTASALLWDGSIASAKARLREAWTRSLGSRSAESAGLDEEDEADMRAYLEARLNSLATDIGALHARLAKGRAEAADAAQREVAEEAARLYRQVHDATPNHYCAVNAASLSLIGGQPEEARRLAQEALRCAERDRPGYWTSASRGEAMLLLGRVGDAESAFADAVSRPDCDLGKTTSTRLQLRLLSAHAGIDVTSIMKILDPGRPVFFSGPLMTSSDDSPAELELAESRLAAAIACWLSERRVPIAFTAAACGADIIFAEAALKAGIPLHIILPFPIDRFAELSVRIGTGWHGRYLDCLDGAETVSELWRHDVAKGSIDHHFHRGNRHLAGETILAAHAIRTEPLMLAVLDGRTVSSLAGTRRAADDFSALGHEVAVIPSPFEPKRSGGGGPPSAASPFAPVVFAFARAQNENDDLSERLTWFGFAGRMMKDRRLAGQKVCTGWQEAFALASLLARRTDGEKGSPVRVVCDYGPVLQRNGAVDEDAILKLEAAFDVTAAVFGDVFATPAFVMAELASGGEPGRYAAIAVAIGREDGGDIVLRGARKIYRVLEASALLNAQTESVRPSSAPGDSIAP